MGKAAMVSVGDAAHGVDLHVAVRGECPAGLESTILRVAHELLNNAVLHGMHARLVGCISVDLVSSERRTALSVIDDGWGCGACPTPGRGLQLVQQLAAARGGDVQLRRRGGMTVALLSLHHAPRPRAQRGSAFREASRYNQPSGDLLNAK